MQYNTTRIRKHPTPRDEQMLPGSADLSQGSIEWAVGTREKAAVQTAPFPGCESTVRSTCPREPSDLQHFRH